MNKEVSDNSILLFFSALENNMKWAQYMQVSRDKTTIYFQYIYHIAFWLLENSTPLQAPNKWQIQID